MTARERRTTWGLRRLYPASCGDTVAAASAPRFARARLPRTDPSSGAPRATDHPEPKTTRRFRSKAPRRFRRSVCRSTPASMPSVSGRPDALRRHGDAHESRARSEPCLPRGSRSRRRSARSARSRCSAITCRASAASRRSRPISATRSPPSFPTLDCFVARDERRRPAARVSRRASASRSPRATRLVPPRRRLPERQRRRRAVGAARVRHLRRQGRQPRPRAAARAAHADRDHAAHDPRGAESAPARAMDELARLSERLVVMSAHGAELLRDVHGVPRSQDRPHPARDPGRAVRRRRARTASASRASR